MVNSAQPSRMALALFSLLGKTLPPSLTPRLVKAWESASYIDTWTSSELSALIVSLVIYCLLFIGATLNFIVFVFICACSPGSYFKVGILDPTKGQSKEVPVTVAGLLALLLLRSVFSLF